MNAKEEFNHLRQIGNEKIFEKKSLIINRFFNLDHQTYQEGTLNAKMKELIGLGISMSMRCEDCIKYHIESAYNQGATEEEILETFEIALMIGGTVVIPYLRKAVLYMDLVFERQKD